MLSIAISELRMLIRNRLVALCAILVPLGLGVFLLTSSAADSGGSFIAVLQIMLMSAMGVYVTATTTLAARRQTLFLKRLRSGAVSDRAILAGLVGPLVLVNVVQIAVVLVALSVTASAPPVHGWLIAIAVGIAELMFVGFSLATAGVTTSPEHAQFTTLPLFIATLGIAFWVVLTGTAELTWLKRALPGGGLAELISLAWNGGDLSVLPLLLAPSIAWAAIAGYAARVMFRWEPRA